MKKTDKPLKILCITPINRLMKTPETGFAELLVKRGHIVAIQHIQYNPMKVEIDRRIEKFNPDVIFGMMEYAIPAAVIYKNAYNIPMYGHIECIPPWRTGIDNPTDWGYDVDEFKTDCFISEKSYIDAIELYKDLIDNFNKCDYKTISGKSWRYTFEEFTGEKLDADIRYYTFDNSELGKYIDNNITEKYQICTISRFVCLKRIHHIIQALGMIDKSIRPKYIIIGYGDKKYEQYLKKLATELDVDVKFVGSGKDGLKNRILQESMFSVQIASGIPVLESAYYNKHTIAYNTAHMVEVFGDMCTWVENNNIKALSTEIEKFIKDKNLYIEKGKQSNEIMVNNKCNILTPEKFVECIEECLYKAIAKHGENK